MSHQHPTRHPFPSKENRQIPERDDLGPPVVPGGQEIGLDPKPSLNRDLSTRCHHGTKRRRRQSRRLSSCRMRRMPKSRMLISMRRSHKKSCAQTFEGCCQTDTGPDGISNRMIQLGGDQFLKLLFLHLSDVWRESTYPDQWASSLMQPLYKGDGKDREDPASYRGIFLSNAMLKLFEGILESRLQVFTEKFDTLTPSQQGSRPGRQRHDAIYSLLAAIQQQKQSPQKSMQGATPSRGASYCEFVD